MQTQFFEQPQEANTNQPSKRIFLYDGQLFEDPGPDYSVQDVLSALAQTYPELEHGTWSNRQLPDGTQEITFVKVTGEKGSDGEQAPFFAAADGEGPPLLPGPTAPKRIFLYDGQIFEDPGAAFSTQEVLSFLAQTYPELEHGTWSSRRLPDGTEEITFVKVTGEKGSDPTRLSPHQLAARLTALEPTDLQATGLVRRIIAAEKAGGLSAITLMELAPEIEAALQQVEQTSQQSQRILKRCLDLKPMPQPTVPLGF